MEHQIAISHNILDKKVSFNLPNIIAHNSDYEKSDYNSDITKYEYYLFKNDNDTVTLEFAYMLKGQIECIEVDDTTVVNFIINKIQEENRYASNFESKTFSSNGFKIYSVTYNYGNVTTSCFTNQFFNFSIKNMTDTALIHKIINSIKIL